MASAEEASERQRLLRTGLALQDIQSRFRGAIDLPVPRFVILGIQSSGKTTLLNVICGRRVAGGIKDGAGTMRPVVYHCRRSDSATRELCVGGTFRPYATDEELFRAIDAEMAPLQQQRQYNADPIYVRISGPEAFDCVLEDLPGRPAELTEANRGAYEAIEAMYRQRIMQPHAVPVVVQLLSAIADADRVLLPITRLCELWPKDGAAARRAIFFLNGVNFMKDMPDAVQVMGLVYTQLGAHGFDRRRIAVGSLRWQHLEGRSHVEENGAYFAQFRDAEAAALRAFFQQRAGTAVNDFLLGVGAVQRLLEHEVIESVRCNLHTFRGRAEQELLAKTEAAEQLGRTPRPADVRKRALQLVNFVVSVISAAGNADFPACASCLETFADEHPRHVDGLGRGLVQAVFDSLKLTYDEELATLMSGRPRTAHGYVGDLFTPTVRADWRASSDFSEQLGLSLFGGAAVRRAMTVVRLCVAAGDLRAMSHEDVVNAEGGVVSSGVQTTDLHKIVRDIASTMSVSPDVLRFTAQHCAAIYSRLAGIVISVVRSHVTLLDDVPVLRDMIYHAVEREYVSIFNDAAQRTSNDIASLLDARDSTLRVHQFISQARLLSLCRLPPSLLPDIGNLATATGAPSGLMAEVMRVAGACPAAVALSRLLFHLQSGEGHVDPATAMMVAATNISAADACARYAMMEPLRSVEVLLSELRRSSDDINQFAMAVARFGNCQLIEELCSKINRNITMTAKRIDQTLETRIHERCFARVLNNDERLRRVCAARVRARLSHATEAAEELFAWIEACEVVNRELEVHGGATLSLRRARGAGRTLRDAIAAVHDDDTADDVITDDDTDGSADIATGADDAAVHQLEETNAGLRMQISRLQRGDELRELRDIIARLNQQLYNAEWSHGERERALQQRIDALQEAVRSAVPPPAGPPAASTAPATVDAPPAAANSPPEDVEPGSGS